MFKIKLRLVRPALGKGGDRYEATPIGDQKPIVIYVPQFISRADGHNAAMAFEMTLEKVE